MTQPISSPALVRPRSLAAPIAARPFAGLATGATLWRKRLFDLALLLPLLPFYGLLIATLAAFVRLCDGAPVLFLQSRAGRAQRPFLVFKLRTMTLEPDARERRPTRLGLFLRKRGLDELPQLLNVLRGEMSLVGPRPLAVEDAARLVAAHPPFAERFALPPGLTGAAQILNLRGVQQTAQLESDYARSRSAWGDLRILFKTAWINFAGKPRSTSAVAPRKRSRVPALSFACVLSFLLMWTGIGHEVNRLRELKERGGPAAFSELDLISASALNVIMAAGGYLAGYPEVANETLLLFAPADRGTREFHSALAWRSPEIHAAAQQLAERVARGELNPEMTVSLDGPLSVRLAFAVPFRLSAHRVPEGLQFTVHTRITYPRRAVWPLGPQPLGAPILFDEGIYGALIERGWMHAYWADWIWTEPSDVRAWTPPPPLLWRERMTVAVWQALTRVSGQRPSAIVSSR